MQIKKSFRLLAALLTLALIVATVGCSKNPTSTESETSLVEDNSTNVEESEPAAASVPNEDSSEVQNATVLGEGATVFTFSVTDADGNETLFEIHTDETTVGAALLGVDLIDGEQSDYGLYVKVVNGITADYDVDGTYWAFYIDGEYAMTGVDSTEVVAGATYAFKVEQ
jgi:hypothetical protein